MSSTIVILLVGAFVASSCALVGSFLVLRRMALLGDAISHAVLPGIVIAFLLTHSLASAPMILGASLMGVLTVFLVEVLNRSGRLYEDTSIGVVFPALFSIGVILVSSLGGTVDLDQECVLYGEIAFAGLDELMVGGVSLGPESLWVTGSILALDLLLVVVFYKELKIVSFDPDLAASLGYSPIFIHYLIMAAVSVTVVGSFESVGSILVVAMLVVPPATDYLLTEKLSVMLGLAVTFGILSSSAGYGFSRWYDCSIAGAMASAAGAFFLLAILLSPSHGLVARAAEHRRLRERLHAQLLLLHLKGRAGVGTGMPMEEAELERRFGWRRARIQGIVRRLEDEGLVKATAGRLHLTPAGERAIDEAGTGVLAHPH